VLVASVVLVAVGPARAEQPPLPGALQEKVNAAVRSGLGFLKRTQEPNGSWAPPGERHRVGYAALPALALLECGATRDDPQVARAAAFVRGQVPHLNGTYELALGLLLLDRLGDPNDKKPIQTLALRLIAGQRVTGGWGYTCPVPGALDQAELLRVLQELYPPPQPAAADKNDPAAAKNAAPKKVVIPNALKVYPVLQDPDLHKLVEPAPAADGKRPFGLTDNSNTQFAILALAAANRWDVPVTHTMELVARRFVTSQEKEGGWGYGYQFAGGSTETAAMDCAGLIGLAVAHGIAARQRGVAPNPLSEPRAARGLAALGKLIAQPSKHPQSNRYLLWSIERVGVLYDVAKIGETEWYRWGAELLVANQQDKGFWPIGPYPGSHSVLDTSMALLLLRKANLVKDLVAQAPQKRAELGHIADNKRTAPAAVAAQPVPVAVSAPPPEPVASAPRLEKPLDTPRKPTRPAKRTPAPTPRPAPESRVADGGDSNLGAYLLVGVVALLGLLSAGLIWNNARLKKPGRNGGSRGKRGGSRAGRSRP
jgi:hypothetical protein